MHQTITIGLSGNGLSGKDLLFTLLKQQLKINYGIECKRYSLADELRRELKNFILEKFGFNIFNCAEAQKTKVRPLLVAYAGIKRKETDGRYWLELLQNQMKKDGRFGVTDVPTCNIITDIRFAEYGKDELYWLKNEIKGSLIYVEKYLWDIDYSTIQQPPANSEEAKNNPILKNNADMKFEWNSIGGNMNRVNELSPNVNNLIDGMFLKNILPVSFSSQVESVQNK